MSLLPRPCCISIGFGQGGVDMNGIQHLFQAEVIAHGIHEFRDQIAGMRADYGDAQYSVASMRSNHLDKPRCFTVGNRAVKIIDVVLCHFDIEALCARFGLGQANSRNLGVGENCPGDDSIVDGEFFELAEQCIHCAIPALMPGCMR